MKPKIWRLEWVRADGQGFLPMGEFWSQAAAKAAIPKALKELLAQCVDDAQRESIRAGSFAVYQEDNGND